MLAYLNIEGTPLQRIECLLAQLCAMFASAHGAKRAKPADFLPGRKERGKGMAPDALAALINGSM